MEFSEDRFDEYLRGIRESVAVFVHENKPFASESKFTSDGQEMRFVGWKHNNEIPLLKNKESECVGVNNFLYVITRTDIWKDVSGYYRRDTHKETNYDHDYRNSRRKDQRVNARRG